MPSHLVWTSLRPFLKTIKMLCSSTTHVRSKPTIVGETFLFVIVGITFRTFKHCYYIQIDGKVNKGSLTSW